MPTTAKTPEIAQCYLNALRLQLETPRASGVAVARALGREAMAAGYDTLDLARMHERALIALAADYDFANTCKRLHRRTGRFLTEVLVPLERAHRDTRELLKKVQQRADTLRLTKAELAKTGRQLKREMARRRAGEEALKSGKEHHQELSRQSQIMHKKLRSLAHQVLTAQENERREISRELHDEVVQALVGINVDLAALAKAQTIGSPSLKSKIVSTQRLVEKSVKTVHQFARDLRPAALDDLGLVPALKIYMETLAARKKLRIRLTAFIGVEKLTGDKRTVLYRIAQEALTNVARHAKASLVEVNIRQILGDIRMEVHDDGKSFDVDRVLSSKANKRLGLLGMRERAEMVRGTLTIKSILGEGTLVRAQIPFLPEDTE